MASIDCIKPLVGGADLGTVGVYVPQHRGEPGRMFELTPAAARQMAEQLQRYAALVEPELEGVTTSRVERAAGA